MLPNGGMPSNTRGRFLRKMNPDNAIAGVPQAVVVVVASLSIRIDSQQPGESTAYIHGGRGAHTTEKKHLPRGGTTLPGIYMPIRHYYNLGPSHARTGFLRLIY